MEVNFTFALVGCVRYNKDFVKSRFCSIHFTVILAGLKKIVRYTEDFVIYRGSIVKSRFHCRRFSLAASGRISSALLTAPLRDEAYTLH